MVMKKYHIWTIGCQMNKAESRRIEALIQSADYETTAVLRDADLIVINTCVVRQSAEDKVSGMLNYLKGTQKENPGRQIAVTGCFVDSNTDILKKKYPHVSGFFKAGDYDSFAAWFEERRDDNSRAFTEPSRKTSECCALVPIIQGCNNFCTYCIVPYRRGREISRSPEEIFEEIEGLVSGGIKEVTLVGQNVNSYGHDLKHKSDLSDLLVDLNKLQELLRIRFLTNHPKDMADKLIGTMTSLDKVCRQVNLPLQAGSNAVLASMNRHYTRDHYLSLTEQIKSSIPDISLSTDIIVGFPGETDHQFEETLDMVRKIRFDAVHSAIYSNRPGTEAARILKDNIPPEVKKARFVELENLQAVIASENNAEIVGTTVEILVEGKKNSKWYGRTKSNKLVFFESAIDRLNRIENVKVVSASAWSLQAEPAG
jgi:tRNA-2-methylthio-N6-dimethylallyladenosine synthase